MPNCQNNYRNYSGRPMNSRNISRNVDTDCGCRPKPSSPVKCDPLQGMPLAMAYVPWQEWRNIYNQEKALQRGTIFEELDLPFQGRGGCNR